MMQIQSEQYILLPFDHNLLEKVKSHYTWGRVEPLLLRGHRVYCYVAEQRKADHKRMLLVWRDGSFHFESASRFTGVCHSGDLKIDMEHDLAWKCGQALTIPAAEMVLLKSLVINSHVFISRSLIADILERRMNHMIQDNTVSVHIARLRRALGLYEGHDYIATLSGRGYRWVQQVKWE